MPPHFTSGIQMPLQKCSAPKLIRLIENTKGDITDTKNAPGTQRHKLVLFYCAFCAPHLRVLFCIERAIAWSANTMQVTWLPATWDVVYSYMNRTSFWSLLVLPSL